MKCWKCQTPLPEEIVKIGFRLTCERCSSWLHSCCGCRHHKVNLHNQCEIPDTDFVADREGANHCDSFEPKTDDPSSSTGQNISSAAEKLFGNISEEESSPKKSFDDLF